uniref:Kinesin motor domain-containing protein n=1 Tax=Steinernema glaseri TaxID=37863 RepID=A0A1I7XXJ6_9BILA
MVVLSGEDSPDLVEKVKVAVRVRPFNKREIELKTKCVVSMKNDQTILSHTEKQVKTFGFDHCFYSCDREDPNYADQEEVFNHVGSGVLNNAFAGYNACIFAYGQTGSGKSYSMMGTPDQPGIIPRLCNRMFQRIGECTNETLSFKVEVSYMEIYNEKVRDLLDPKNSSKRPLKVREHKILGPMVDGLSVLAVSSFEQIEKLIEEGNKCRTVAATNMNAESSRSHAVFNIRMTQILTDATNEFTGEKVSKISLVDLAGSERAQKTGAMGKRLEEGGNINKSLTTLGMVISALAEKSNPKKEKFVPYRDSVLTWLLKDNLGGNSKTVMIATISPAMDNYEETLSTLRYADRAKKIVNHAVVNEDPNAKIIRELREEVELLRSQITHTKEKENETEELRERLAESERLVEMMNKSWEDRLKETDTIYKERQKDLEEIGISVAGHGIKVEKDRYYLVNLNADPSLNELLVYYVNKEAVIGSAEHSDEAKVDFLLQGLGVQPLHALLKISDDDGKTLFIEPMKEGARICVNGRPISSRTPLRNGNRLLIGHNHFFRVNCPKVSPMDESTIFDYDDAWLEANSDANANPIGNAVEQYIEQIEIKHKEDKQTALEKQYEEFSRYIHSLAQCMTPSTPVTPGNWNVATTPGCHLPPIAFPSAPKTSERVKFLSWAQRRDDQFKEGLSRLKTEIVRAQALVREANMMTAELKGRKRGQVYYDVTLQIPAGNLRPSKIRDGNLVCEPVIVVKRTGMAGCQFMSIDQLENSLVDMREMYNEREKLDESVTDDDDDDFGSEEDFPMGELVLESQENHSLIGVANVFLEVLFHDVKLDYHVPIISQQGEVAGKLHIEVYRVPSSPFDAMSESTDSIESGSSRGDLGSSFLGKTIRCRIRIKRATSLPSSLSHFVFCQYSFFGLSGDVVAPNFDPNALPSNKIHQPHSSIFQFDYEKDFDVLVTEEFLEYVQEDALSIEVWGHRSSGFDTEVTSTQKDPLDVQQKNKGLQERWSEVTRRVELWVDIRELNDFGEYVPVDVTNRSDEACGGIYQLKQGQQRRIFVNIQDLNDHGILPLNFGAIPSVSIGSIMAVDCEDDDYDDYEDEISLDSYQEEDLERIRTQWNDILEARQHYLEKQINKLSAKGNRKTEKEIEREKALINQWVALTEERNAVSVPPPNSNIPGSLSDWSPPAGVEQHVPVIFLDVNADDIAAEDDTGISIGRVAGTMSTLFGEDCVQMLELPILERDNVSAMCSWDSSIHENVHLNRVTLSGGRVYAIVKIVVRVTHPISMDLIIRKRICLNVYKKPSLTGRIIKKIVGSDAVAGTGVHYNIVAHIPKSSLDMEDRETLAMMAAVHALSTDDDNESPKSSRCDTSYIEAYTKGIQAVECMLKLDRLRQESATFNMLSKHERGHRHNGSFYGSSMRMKRAISLPNTMNNSARLSLPADAKLMEMSTSSSSGVSSMARPTFLDLKPLIASRMTSLVSPLVEQSEARLSGIDEELHYGGKEPVRSSTVPETLASAVAALGKSAGTDRLNGNCVMDHSATSSDGLSSSTFSDSIISNSDEHLVLNNNVTTPKSLLISNLGDRHVAVADLEVNV